MLLYLQDAAADAASGSPPVPELGWTAAGAIITALLYCVVRWYFTKPRVNFLARTTRGHFLDGIALFPMSLLVVSPFIKGLGEALVQHDNAILAAAGVVAILAVLEPDRGTGRKAPANGKAGAPTKAQPATKPAADPKPKG